MHDNNKISFLIFGLGSIGKRHLRNLAALGITNIAVLRREKRLPTDNDLPKFHIETDLKRALNRKPTAVIVASPTSLHIEQALAAAGNGCHIFFEKPISHNFDGLETLQEIVSCKKLTVQVGFQFRFHPVLKKIKMMLEERILGEIVSVHSHWGEYLPSWHPWEDYRQGYSARQDLGGGVVLTLSHPFDYFRWLFGEIQSLHAITGKLSNLDIDTEDVAMVNVKFTSGVIGSIYLDYIERPPRHDLSIIGNKGKITWDNSSGIAHIFSNENANVQVLQPEPEFERNSMFLQEIKHFIDCIQNNNLPACTFQDGISALEIGLAVKKSSLEKQEVQLHHHI